MKKSFEYDLTKYDPNAPTRTEQFLTDDGVKTLITDANNGAVLIQDSVDPDSLNPVTAAAVATAVAGASGEVPIIGDGDNGKVLTAVVDGSSKSVAWETPSGSSYDAGDGIAISEGTISAKVDGTSITVNASGELEAIGGGGQYIAGDGITIDDDDGTLVPAPYSDWPVTVRCNTGFVSVSGASCSLVNFNAIVGSNSFRVFATYWDSLHPGQPITTAYPYFLNVADSSKYVSSSSTTTVTKVGDYYRVDNLNISNLVLDTSHAGEGFNLADLATSAWSLGFSPTSTYSAVDAMLLSSNSSEWPTYSSTSGPKSISVTVPVPTFSTTTDVGKVLQVTSNGLAWVTLS